VPQLDARNPMRDNPINLPLYPEELARKFHSGAAKIEIRQL